MRVKDAGIGIEPAMLPQIPGLFAHVDPSSTRSKKDMGKGLSLRRKLVEMRGGGIAVQSAGAGKCARFTVRDPHRRIDSDSGAVALQ